LEGRASRPPIGRSKKDGGDQPARFALWPTGKPRPTETDCLGGAHQRGASQ